MKELYLLMEDYLNENISKGDFKEQVTLFVQNECRKAFEAGKISLATEGKVYNQKYPTFEDYLKSINL